MLTFPHHLIRWLRFHTDPFFAGTDIRVCVYSFIFDKLFRRLKGIIFLGKQRIYLIEDYLIVS